MRARSWTTVALTVGISLVALAGCSSRATSDPASGSGSPSTKATSARTSARPPGQATARPPARDEVAIFAGGCFWCMETQYEGLPGVRSVVSGYTGGHKADPTYEEVGTHQTGHYEAIEIRYDPARVAYSRLLDIFWHSIDPTQADGQFCDIGSSYRSAIFAEDSTQLALALASKKKIEASGVLHAPIVTAIVRATRFYPAEGYHQDFWKKDPVRYHSYRLGCGRDRRLTQLWGRLAAKPNVH